MTGRQGAQAAVGQANYVVGVITQIDANHVAEVKSRTQTYRCRIDLVPGKGAPPREGETWILAQPYGLGWQLMVPYGFLADTAWLYPALVGSWVDVGAPNLATGYRKDASGWVTLCGKMTGVSANTTAFVLPVGYRPEGTWTQNGVIVDVSGNVKPQSTTPTLDGVRFYSA